jgi:hypothetical protein
MAIIWEINLGKYENAINDSIINWINTSLSILKNAIDSHTPEDTRTLLWNNKINRASNISWTIKWSVENNTEYAIYVEYWVRWKSFNYHKPKWSVFYSWVWARMFSKALDEKKSEIINIIKSNIKYNV